MSPISKRLVTKDEEVAIFLHLMAPQDHVQRLGLIKVCELLQSGRLFGNNSVHHAVRGFVFGSPEETERWALKALVEFRNPGDFDLVRSRLEAKPVSIENLSWTIAAFFATANQEQIEQAFADRLISRDGLSLLAYNFTGQPPRDEFSGLLIDIDKADALELKWGCLCFATGRTKGDIFNPRFNQIEQLGALNGHDDEDVAQYSVYAMVRLPGVSVGELTIPLHQIGSKPAGLRKWSYRLLTKTPDQVGQNLDFVQQVARFESSVKAQEGLALGLVDVWVDGLDFVTVDWIGRQPEERVENALLSHMARQSTRSPAYSEIVIKRFSEAAPDGLRRGQLMASAAGTPLYGELQRQVIAEGDMLDMFGFSQKEVLQVTGNNNMIFTGGVNQLAGVSAGGNASAERTQQTNQEVLEQVRRLVEQARPERSAASNVVVSEADRFFASPGPEAGKSLGQALLAWGGGVLGTAANLATIAEYLGSWGAS